VSRITERPTLEAISPRSAKSYRMHAKRYGIRAAAASMRAKGYSLAVALEVLAGRRAVFEASTLEPGHVVLVAKNFGVPIPVPASLAL
jgi:hypothetical protein